jgi:hypothetical protein
MHDQPRYEPYERSDFFADHRASRHPVPGTVARGQLHEDEFLQTGQVNGKYVESFPFAITLETMERGRTRYDIYCTPCHGIPAAATA